MSFLNTRIDHNRSKESAEWLEEEIAEQLERYKKIVSDMDAASEKREQWYQEFFDRIQNQGFYAIAKSEFQLENVVLCAILMRGTGLSQALKISSGQ